jgi:hypothetical protein
METISLEATPKTPYIKFDAEQGTLEIKGRSIPENARKFYKPLIDGIDQYSSNPVSPTLVYIQLEYFNTASSKYIFDMLKCFEKIHNKGTKVDISWYYDEDDEHVKGIGMEFQEKLSLPFNFVKRKLG